MKPLFKGRPRDGLMQIALGQIADNPFQPRREIRKKELERLMQSIAACGLINPILVRPIAPEHYQVLAGSRRLAACRGLGHKTIQAIVRKLSDQEAAEVSLTENIQHASLTRLETADAFNTMASHMPYFSRDELAERIGLDQETARAFARPEMASPILKEAVLSGLVSEEHASVIHALDSSIQLAVLKKIIRDKLTVTQTVQLAQRYRAGGIAGPGHAIQPPKGTMATQCPGEPVHDAPSPVRAVRTEPRCTRTGEGHKKRMHGDDVYELATAFFRQLQLTAQIPFGMCHDTAALISLTAAEDMEDFLDFSFSYGKDAHVLSVHAVNVAKLCARLGNRMQLERRQKDNLVLAGFLHDVGLAFLPPPLLDSRGALTSLEREMIHQHPAKLCRLLDKSDVDDDVRTACMDHHERNDGSGFPRAKKDHEISTLGRILSLLDVYESLSTARRYRPAMLPRHALQTVRFLATENRLDQNVFHHFLEAISLYPVGSLVRLDTGEIARVIDANAGAVALPVIRILLTPDGKWSSRPEKIDLSTMQGVRIVDAVPASILPG